jgi:hypothetical protein
LALATFASAKMMGKLALAADDHLSVANVNVVNSTQWWPMLVDAVNLSWGIIGAS